MGPAEKLFCVRKGNSFSRGFKLTTISASASVPLDLTGSEFVFFAKWRGGSMRKSTADDDGFEITDAANGRLSLFLTDDETSDLPAGSIPYEIERRIGSEQISYLAGVLQVEEGLNDG